MPGNDPDRDNPHRYRWPRPARWRILAGGAAVVAAIGALVASPAAGASAGGGATGNPSCPWVTSTAPIDQRVSQLMSQMSLDDEISMVEGHGTTNPYVFYTPAIPALCIPAVGLEDGPAGVADGMTGVTQLPAGVALAATWDPSLAQQYGTVIGAVQGMVFLYIGQFTANDYLTLLLSACGVMLLIMYCNLLHRSETIVIGCMVFLAIMLGRNELSPFISSLNRLLDTFIGVFVAVIINRFVLNPSVRKQEESDSKINGGPSR